MADLYDYKNIQHFLKQKLPRPFELSQRSDNVLWSFALISEKSLGAQTLREQTSIVRHLQFFLCFVLDILK
jgi:hypothetical protein